MLALRAHADHVHISCRAHDMAVSIGAEELRSSRLLSGFVSYAWHRRSKRFKDGVSGDPLRDAEALVSFIKMEDGLLNDDQVKFDGKCSTTAVTRPSAGGERERGRRTPPPPSVRDNLTPSC